MKKLTTRKILALFIIMMGFSFCKMSGSYASEIGETTNIQANGDHWVLDNNGWWYCWENGGFPVNQWLKIDGYWYYFDNLGYIKIGWYNDGSRDFYFDHNGKMQIGWILDNGNWYYTNYNGELVKGWVLDNNRWYYLDNDGKMVIGWRTINNQDYYFNSLGVMAVNWALCDDDWYYFNSNGIYQTGWILDRDYWYYLDNSGKMCVGLKEINNRMYYLLPSGKMAIGWAEYNDKWYYANEQGHLEKGWLQLNNDWYYLDENYSMKTGWFVDENKRNFYFENSGIMARGVTKTADGTYYFNWNGEMQTGLQIIGGKYYFFDYSSGKMLQKQWQYINGLKYYFGIDGILVQDVDNIIGRQNKYYLDVNTYQNTVTIYAYDATTKRYSIPVKKMVCSTGKSATPTVKGTFTVRRLGRWYTLMGPVYGQYVSQIYGGYLFHSAWYYVNGDNRTLSVSEYRKLGNNASHGCVRLTTADAKWIYNYCNGSTVRVFSGTKNDTLFDKPVRPEPIVIKGDYGYDPTDV